MDDGCMADYYDPDYSWRGGYPDTEPDYPIPCRCGCNPDFLFGVSIPDEGRMALERDEAAFRSSPWLRADEIKSFLGQTKHWKNGSNEIIPLKDIDARYAGNIVGFLERKAPSLMALVDDLNSWAEAQMDGVGYSTPLSGRVDPTRWIAQHKLYKALNKIARKG